MEALLPAQISTSKIFPKHKYCLIKRKLGSSSCIYLEIYTPMELLSFDLLHVVSGVMEF